MEGMDETKAGGREHKIEERGGKKGGTKKILDLM